MSLSKLSLGWKNLKIPGQGESLVSDILAGDGKMANLFLQCNMPASFFKGRTLPNA
jgi:hypothetical protein